MFVVAGPPGAGKSTAFPVADFGVAHFNADDRASQLNGGSYSGISIAIREQVNWEFEQFVFSAIEKQEGFAIETTLRSGVTFEQSTRARVHGFRIEMRYLALKDFSLHLERIKGRADAGGHSASEATLRRIHQASLANMKRAVVEMDQLWVYDNSKFGGPMRLVLEARKGKLVFIAPSAPAWVAAASS